MNSSTDLFLHYRQTLVQFARFSTGAAFAELCRLFGKWLVVFSDLLVTKFPKDEKKAMSEDDLRTIWLVINTADYCYNTTGQVRRIYCERMHWTLTPLHKARREAQRENRRPIPRVGQIFKRMRRLSQCRQHRHQTSHPLL